MIKETDKRFVNALKTIADNGLSFDVFEKIGDGINSYCWKLYNKKQCFFLKFYKNNNIDNRDRLATESKFLKLLNTEGFKNVPKLIYSNPSFNWSLLTWIEGEKITSPNASHWKTYLNFLINLQNLRKSNLIYKLENASEACFSLNSHFSLIENRLNLIIIKTTEQQLFNNLNYWLRNEIVKRMIFIKKEITQDKNLENLSLNEKIISPSDVGFHNVINSYDELYFIDFEYAGWDDPYKLFMDLIIRPENLISSKDANNIMIELSERMRIKLEKNKLIKYIELYRIKWVLIILNKVKNKQINSNNESLKIYNKVLNYYKEVASIWKLK